jgi:glycosyltransferase involved in cell wall biosynthesis
VAPNPVITAAKLEASLDEPQHPWFQHRTAPVVVAVGRLTEAKDYPTLLRAFDILKTTTDARLLIIGEGELRGDLERDIAAGLGDRVQLVGAVENPMAWMRAADLFVMSSIREGMPSALIEALAVGAKVVSTDCRSGPHEVLAGGQFGWLTPVGDAAALADAMEEAIGADAPSGSDERAMEFTLEASLRAYLEMLR